MAVSGSVSAEEKDKVPASPEPRIPQGAPHRVGRARRILTAR